MLVWLCLALLAAATGVIVLRPRRWRRIAVALVAPAAMSLMSAIAIAGWRWQALMPCLAMMLVAAVLAVSCRPAIGALARRSRALRLLGAGLLLVVLAIGGAIHWFFPLMSLPGPGGPFAVGGMRMRLVDPSRYEVHTAQPFDRRALMVQIWYPAVPALNARPQPLIDRIDLLRDAVNGEAWPVGWLLDDLGRIATHTVPGAPVAKASAPYPVVAFSHGLGGLGVQNILLCEELASRGYIVVSIERRFDGLATIFPDGSVSTFRGEAYRHEDPPLPKAIEADLDRVRFSEDAAVIGAAFRKLVALQPAEAASDRFWLDYWSEDQRFVIDRIAAMANGALASPFQGRIDLSRIGVMGMSFGGSTAQITCSRDSRCRAGINMDGSSAILIDLAPQTRPFLYFNSEQLSVGSQFLARDLGGSSWVKITDAQHYDFTDLPAVLPIARQIGLTGPVEPSHVQAILKAYVVAFFDRHLRGRPAPLLERSRPPWADVRFRTQLQSREPHP